MSARAIQSGYSLQTFKRPVQLLASEHRSLRDMIVAVSDEAFGRPTASLWKQKYSESFLGALARFYVVRGESEQVVGWSGYRAATIARERVLYFTSTGLLPRCQGLRLIPAVQHRAVAYEARRHPLCPVTTCIRTRNPHSYQLAMRTFGGEPVPLLDGSVPPGRRAVVAGICAWLGFDRVDPATAIVHDAYDVDGNLYGTAPQTGDPAIDELFARLEPKAALLILGRRTWRAAFALSSVRPDQRQVLH